MLAGENVSESYTKEGNSLYRNFLTMCVAFSFNHGCVVSCLAYATTELGDSIGGYGSGCLYVFYALTALLVAKPIVAMVGPKTGLLLGVSGYCIYIGGFLFSILVPALAWPVFLLSASIGGIAGGLLWPSQGRYFARNAKCYSEATGIPADQINSSFAGIFATSYLGLEMITKVLATAIFLAAPNAAAAIVFTVYTIIAVCSVFVVAALSDLNERGTWDFQYDVILANVGAASHLVYEDNRLLLMLPFQIAFGFASSFVPYYVFGTVIGDSDDLGETYVGLLSAIIVLTGASMGIPSAWAANHFGKPIVMVVGGVCLSLTGFLFFVLTNKQLGTWALIVPYLVVYGMGRGTWENTNKAVIADLFMETPQLSTSAFAAIAFFNGFAGAIGYFTFSSMTRDTMAAIVALFSLFSILSYLASHRLQCNRLEAAGANRGAYESVDKTGNA